MSSSLRELIKPAVNLYGGVVPKIGLEIHAKLKLRTKLFSSATNRHDAPPNSTLDILDVALPGSLPNLNKDALKLSIKAALGLNAVIQPTIHFDRKNYFYEDMPAGYQITQNVKPVAKNGYVEFIVNTQHRSLVAHSEQYDIVKYLYASDRHLLEDFKPYLKKSTVRQIQLEQDSAKSLHDTDSFTMIDYNRSGASLIEVVFDPDLSNHHEASALARELIWILKQLEVCDCQLQEGSLRVDANISIDSIDGQVISEGGSKRVELKNLNSLKALNRGILCEISRQSDLIKNGQEVLQETRTFDGIRTVPLRLKEAAVDYRYVPEPNIPPIALDESLVQEVKASLPEELTCDIREYLLNLNLEPLIVVDIMEDALLYSLFREVHQGYDVNTVADFLIYCLSNLKQLKELSFIEDELVERLRPETLRQVFDLMLSDTISFMTGYELIKFIVVAQDPREPRELVEKFGWFQINDRKIIVEACSDVIKENQGMAKKFAKRGEKKHLRMLLNKLSEANRDRVSIKKSITVLEELLRPPKTS